MNVPQAMRLILAFVAISVSLARADSSPTTAPALRWLDTLDAAYLQSQRTGQPILVFAASGAPPAPRGKWEALGSSSLAPHLAGFTLLRLDSLQAMPTVRAIGIVSFPALRVLTSTGRVIASRDEAGNATELATWLDAQTAAIPTTNPARDPALDRLLDDLDSPDAITRESAARALVPNPATASLLIGSLPKAGMTARLTILALLERWNAPVAEIDAWQPATLTADRLAKLRAWSAAQPTTLPIAGAADGLGRGGAPSIALDLDALVSAPSDADARRIRERLILSGNAVQPLVVARLQNSPREPARHRLLALRYRLAATEQLAAAWPGGFDLLAAADPPTRHAALSTLESLARPEDHRLLRELFTDSDPFMREAALQLLRKLGGPHTSQDLVHLLSDPEPNVRAAVLKTLAESPDETLTEAIAKYAQTEGDEDLVVAAIRVLQQTSGQESVKALEQLLSHSQWRVRGDAAEALRAKADGNSNLSDEDKAGIYAALVRVLDDPEGYVVSRAAAALIRSGLQTAAAPLVKAARRQPDLADTVLRAVAEESGVGISLVPDIRELSKDNDPRLRAAGVTALCALVPRTAGDDVKRAFGDSDPRVRMAALRGTVTALKKLFPADGTVTHSSYFGLRQTQEKVNLTKWAEDFRAGTERPAWLAEIEPNLHAVILATRPASQPTVHTARVEAAVVLCALGKESTAMDTLLAGADVADLRGEAADALVWLPPQPRLLLFRRLLSGAHAGEIRQILDSFSMLRDEQAAPEIWALLGPDADAALLSPVHGSLQTLYLGQEYYRPDALPTEQKAKLVAELSGKATGGSELQRAAALALLLTVSYTDAAQAARTSLETKGASDMQRTDALQILLMSAPTAEARKAAVAAMGDPITRKIALPYLAAGRNAIYELRGDVYLYTQHAEQDPWQYSGAGAAVVPPQFDDLPADMLRDVARSSDATLSAYAGFLLACIGDRSGLEPLLKTARVENFSGIWGQLVYRAAAKLNDDSLIPLVQEIYSSYDKENWYQAREMYWTIRSMTGPNILKLRKKIRDDVGMQHLQ